MSPFNLFQRISKAPTNPTAPPKPRQFDIADLYQGPLNVAQGKGTTAVPLDEKRCSALAPYRWRC